MKSKPPAHRARRISAVHERRFFCNQKIIIDSRESEGVVSDVNLFTSLEHIESTRTALANGMVVTYSDKGSISVSTGNEWFTLATIYYVPSLHVNLMP